MFNKVLILSASAGAGHVRAAQALEQAFSETQKCQEIRNIDTLEYTNPLFRNLYSKTYIEMVNKAPQMLGWLYDQMDEPYKNEKLRLAFDKLNTRPFVKMLQDYDPDTVVCTHFLPSEIISWLKSKKRFRKPQSIVVTDLDVHAMWLCRHCEHYFVALPETHAHLQTLGVPIQNITVTGIPIDPVFAQAKDKVEMRRKHKLHKDRTTILMSAGGFGVGPLEQIIRPLLHLKHPAQILAIAGKNAELKKRLEKLASTLSPRSHVSLHVVGFTQQMDEYMAASDILLGKPGGLTTSEALAKGLVFVIVNPIPGQEERNSDHLLEEGAAIRCNNLPVLAFKIDQLLDQPARFTQMQANSRRMSRPHAARDVVMKLCALAK